MQHEFPHDMSLMADENVLCFLLWMCTQPREQQLCKLATTCLGKDKADTGMKRVHSFGVYLPNL
jgi:hypothetical protein